MHSAINERVSLECHYSNLVSWRSVVSYPDRHSDAAILCRREGIRLGGQVNSEFTGLWPRGGPGQ